AKRREARNGQRQEGELSSHCAGKTVTASLTRGGRGRFGILRRVLRLSVCFGIGFSFAIFSVTGFRSHRKMIKNGLTRENLIYRVHRQSFSAEGREDERTNVRDGETDGKNEKTNPTRRASDLCEEARGEERAKAGGRTQLPLRRKNR